MSSKKLDRSIYLFTGVASGVLNLVLLVAPVLAIKLATDLAFTEGDIGALLSLELGAFALATIPAFLWLGKINTRLAFYIFGSLALVGNLMSGFFQDFASLATWRVVAAFAAGSLNVIILSLGGRASKPTRAFGIYVLAQATFGAIVLFIFPAVYSPLPIAALYWTSSILMIPVLLLVRMIPSDILRGSESEAGVGQRDIPRFLAGLVAVLLLNGAGVAVWVFAGQIALTAGLSADSVSFAVGVATLVALVGPVLAISFGESNRAWIVVLVSFGLVVLGTWLLVGINSAITLAIAVTLLNLGWQTLPPYLFAGVAATTKSPHAMSILNLLIGIGFTAGPILAGIILQSTGSSDPLLYGAAALLGIAGLAGVFSVGKREVS